MNVSSFLWCQRLVLSTLHGVVFGGFTTNVTHYFNQLSSLHFASKCKMGQHQLLILQALIYTYNEQKKTTGQMGTKTNPRREISTKTIINLEILLAFLLYLLLHHHVLSVNVKYRPQELNNNCQMIHLCSIMIFNYIK